MSVEFFALQAIQSMVPKPAGCSICGCDEPDAQQSPHERASKILMLCQKPGGLTSFEEARVVEESQALLAGSGIDVRGKSVAEIETVLSDQLTSPTGFFSSLKSKLFGAGKPTPESTYVLGQLMAAPGLAERVFQSAMAYLYIKNIGSFDPMKSDINKNSVAGGVAILVVLRDILLREMNAWEPPVSIAHSINLNSVLLHHAALTSTIDKIAADGAASLKKIQMMESVADASAGPTATLGQMYLFDLVQSLGEVKNDREVNLLVQQIGLNTKSRSAIDFSRVSSVKSFEDFFPAPPKPSNV